MAYTPGSTTGAAIQAARQGDLTTVGSVDALLTELNAPDDATPAPQGGKLFSELLREYLKDRDGEPPTEPDDEPTSLCFWWVAPDPPMKRPKRGCSDGPSLRLREHLETRRRRDDTKSRDGQTSRSRLCLASPG
jgi:hypothetical protein